LAKTNKAARELEEFDKVFKALAHPTRRYILTLLLAEKRLSAGEIVAYFEEAWPTITRHLKQLEDAGLIMSEKESTQLFYSLVADHLRTVVNRWLQWF
jgi:DNA-binding transcriptional ArsR family regulator